MKEETIMLKSYRKEIEVLSMEVEVPTYDDERRNKYFYSYEDLLLKLFNNKRDDKDILKIENYYGNNYIRVLINLTSYIEHNNSREESIEHLKRWFTSGLDVADDDIEVEFIKGYIYTISEYENKIETYRKNGDNFEVIQNYIEWED